jgi:hypothetical protein
MMPLPDHQNHVDMHTSIMCIQFLIVTRICFEVVLVGGMVGLQQTKGKIWMTIILIIMIFSHIAMMPLPDHQNHVDMHTSIMCINILQNIKAVAPKL